MLKFFHIQNVFSESRFFGFDSESKEYNAEAHRDRIFGKHVAEYMKQLQDEDENAYKKQFSKFIAAGLTSENVSFLLFLCCFPLRIEKWVSYKHRVLQENSFLMIIRK